MSVTRPSFRPERHIIKLRGQVPYLEVKWRLLWLRRAHPNAAIETELVETDERHSVFKATVTIPGAGSATGYGSETADDFGDHLERAETKALGRALLALGFAAEFVPEGQRRAVGR